MPDCRQTRVERFNFEINMRVLANIRALINAMEFDGLLDKNCHTHTVAFSCLMQPIMCALERATAIVCVVGGGRWREGF